MALRGHSETTCNKNRTAFTTKSVVFKSLSLLQLKLLTRNTSNLAKALYDFLTLFPCSHSNDGATIKAAVEHESVIKTNVVLTCAVDSLFIKESSPPDPWMFHIKEK